MHTTPHAANHSRMANQPKQAKITNKIDSIDDLKKINFRQSVPKHSLLLLHWFANTVKIEDHGIWLTFDPKRQYGSHGYSNQDGLLPLGHQYYTVGNLNRDKHEFPSYMYYELRENVGKNLDRIIFSVNEHGVENGAGSMIEEVYLTQHSMNEHQEAAYDRGNIYLVSPNLLKQMRRFSEIELKQSLWILNSEFRSNATDFQLLDFYEQWSFPHLELLLFTVTQKTQFFQKRKRYRVAAHAATFPSLHSGPGFATGIPENRENQVNSEGREIPAGGLWDQSLQRKPEVMTETKVKYRKVPTPNECQPATDTETSSSQTTMLSFAVGIPTNRHDQKETEASEICTRGLQDQSNETKPEVLTGAHEKGRRAWSDVTARNKCQPATHGETSSSQTAAHISKNRHKQKGSEGSARSAGGLQGQSNETKGEKEVMTGAEEKNKIAWRNVSSRNKYQPATHVATSSALKTAPGFAVCIPEIRDSQVMSEGSEISTGGLHDQSKETKPEVMTGAEEKDRIAGKNVPKEKKCQPETHVATSSSQTTGSEMSTGGLQDQRNETKPEVTTGAHEKHRIVWSNVPTHHKCHPATHVATSSSQTAALGCAVSIPEYEVMTDGPEISTGDLQGQSDKVKPEGMTGADEMNEVIWSNMPTCNECQPAANLASSSSQTAVLAAGIPEHTQNPMDAEGSGVNSEGFEVLQNQTGDIKLEVVTGTDGKARIIWSNIPSHPKKQDMMVALFKNNEDQDASKSYNFIGSKESGRWDTSVPLNEGLQARLLNAKIWFFFWKGVGQEICRSVEFQNPEPVNITGYEARLQLFVRDGKACARLYVKKSFRAWKSEFNGSWVEFYTSADRKNKEYRLWQWQWQWATKFKPCHDWEDSTYDVYEYDSGRAIAQGVQARFMLRDEVVKASTPIWK